MKLEEEKTSGEKDKPTKAVPLLKYLQHTLSCSHYLNCFIMVLCPDLFQNIENGMSNILTKITTF